MVNELIQHGYKIVNAKSKALSEKGEKYNDELFIMLMDSEGEIIGSITLMRNLDIVFSKCGEDCTPINCTLSDIEEIIGNTHLIHYEFSNLNKISQNSDFLEDLKKIFKEINN